MKEAEMLIKIYAEKDSDERREKIAEKEKAFKIYLSIPLKYRLMAFELTKEICSDDHQNHEFIDYIIEFMSRHSYKAALFSFISSKEFGSGCPDFDVQLVILCNKIYVLDSMPLEESYNIIGRIIEKYSIINTAKKKELLDIYNVALKEYCYIVKHLGIPLTPTKDEIKKMCQWYQDNSET